MRSTNLLACLLTYLHTFSLPELVTHRLPRFLTALSVHNYFFSQACTSLSRLGCTMSGMGFGP